MGTIDLKKHFDAAVNPPEGWQGDLYFHNRLGQKIRYGHAPARGTRRGTVVLTHGYAEHIDLYHETIKRYQAMGYEVWAMDWQGHGKSERDDPAHPLRPGTRGLMRLAGDLDFFVHNIVKAHHDPATPLMLSTHSMGGHISLLYLKKHPGIFDAAVMSAPMYDIFRLGLGRWARPAIRFIFNAAAAMGLRDVGVPTVDELKAIFPRIGAAIASIFKSPSTLRGELREMMKDLTPDAKLGRPTFGWIAAAYNTIVPSTTEEFLKSIKTPVLIASAEKEDLVDNGAHKRAAEIMPNARHVTIEGARHGLWFEDDGPFEAWWSHIAHFTAQVEQTVARGTVPSDFDMEKTLRGRIVTAHRCPVCPEDIRHPPAGEDLRPSLKLLS